MISPSVATDFTPTKAIDEPSSSNLLESISGRRLAIRPKASDVCSTLTPVVAVNFATTSVNFPRASAAIPIWLPMAAIFEISSKLLGISVVRRISSCFSFLTASGATSATSTSVFST